MYNQHHFYKLFNLINVMQINNFLNATLIVIIFVIFLQACQQASIRAETPDDALLQKLSEEQKCANKICSQNQQCVSGDCICQSGFKDCNNACIPSISCCSADDCSEGQYCNEQNVCKISPKLCSYLQTWDAETESCVCSDNAKFCDLQNKCIPKNHCCDVLDCTFRRDICQETKYSARICIKDDLLHCKTINEGQNDLFLLKNDINDMYYRIHVNSIVENGNTNIIVNRNSSKLLLLNTTQQLAINSVIYADYIKHSGGVCKTYSDD